MCCMRIGIQYNVNAVYVIYYNSGIKKKIECLLSAATLKYTCIVSWLHTVIDRINKPYLNRDADRLGI